MNKVWTELNKAMQTQIKKKDTYEAGIDTLFVIQMPFSRYWIIHIEASLRIKNKIHS